MAPLLSTEGNSFTADAILMSFYINLNNVFWSRIYILWCKLLHYFSIWLVYYWVTKQGCFCIYSYKSIFYMTPLMPIFCLFVSMNMLVKLEIVITAWFLMAGYAKNCLWSSIHQPNSLFQFIQQKLSSN